MSSICEYICVACNRTPKSLQWSPVDGTVAFGAGRSIAIAIFEEPAPQVEYTLHGHTGRVNCVQFIKHRSLKVADKNCIELVSGASDNTIKIWKRGKEKFVPTHTLIGHDAPVTAVASTYLVGEGDNSHGNPSTVLVSTSVDSTLRVWLRKAPLSDFRICQTLSFGRGFVLSMDLYLLQNNIPLLACGGEDSLISLYLWRDEEFVKVLTLPGHEDWVRDVKFAQTENGNLLLASASQDNFVRLWNISLKSDKEGTDPNELRVKENTFVCSLHGNTTTYTVSLEAVLIGHEDWVYSLDWHPVVKEGGRGQ
jgi:elongator complex protein 2